MSKGLTPLKALKILNEYACNNLEYLENNDDLYPIIKTALKDYEKIIKDYGVDFIKQISQEPDDLKYKKLKALEIIKEKMVSLDDLNDAIYEDSYHENNEHNAIDIYNQNRFEYKQLTQEQFDLLKEILKDE